VPAELVAQLKQAIASGTWTKAASLTTRK